jgi:hypothetical protein
MTHRLGSRPQTLYGISDSPVGLAAWLLDHNDAEGQPAAAVATALNRTSSAIGVAHHEGDLYPQSSSRRRSLPQLYR